MSEATEIAYYDSYEFEENEDWEYYYENFIVDVDDVIDKYFGYPVKLRAVGCRWDGSGGYCIAEDIDKVKEAIFSFGNEVIYLKHSKENGYYFRTSSHDVPMGFNIYIEPITEVDSEY